MDTKGKGGLIVTNQQLFQAKMKKRKSGHDESLNGNDGDDEGFESSPDKV